MGSALDQAEKVLAEQYKRELDQDENIWRSLPFFAATLALELTALYQVVAQLNEVPTSWRIAASLLLICVMVFVFVAVLFAVLMVPQDRYRYVTGNVDLLRFATELDEAVAIQGPVGTDAGTLFRSELARQYAAATERNQVLNMRRNGSRGMAGLCSLVAVLLTIPLVGLVYWHNVDDMISGAIHVQSPRP